MAANFESWFSSAYVNHTLDSAFACHLRAAWDAAEEKFTSTNIGSPKLPTLDECQREVQSQLWTGAFKSSMSVTEIVYNFIVGNIRAGA